MGDLPLQYERLENGAVVFSLWDCRSDEPAAKPGDPERPFWKGVLKRAPELVFLLGAARDAHRPEKSLEDL